MSTRILIADDEHESRRLLELLLEEQGYEVLMAQDGVELVRLAQEHAPDLVLADLMMPGLDGYEAIKQLRSDIRTAHIPMIILTARASPSDVVVGFETGADDYVTKPFNIPELLARIRGQLRRAAQQPTRNPLTGLPGNTLLAGEIGFRLRRPDPFALLYIDLDYFKAFNDTYGFARGDRVILLLADVISAAVRKHGGEHDFIGHIGGDDFALLTTPDRIDTLCQTMIAAFDAGVRSLYDAADLERGYLEGHDRQGGARRFPIISISIGVVDSRLRQFSSAEEVGRAAALMKQFAKQQGGSSYALDRREADTAVPQERRGSNVAAVLLISADPVLRDSLRAALHQGGYRALEARSIPDAHRLLAQGAPITLMCADARLDGPLWELAESLRREQPELVLVILSTRADDEERAFAHGAQAFIQQPFQIQQFLACVAQFARRGE